jgi:hypothetical protein
MKKKQEKEQAQATTRVRGEANFTPVKSIRAEDRYT